MKGITIRDIAFYLLISYCMVTSAGRSKWRPKDPTLPEISSRWSDGTETFTIRDHCLEFHAIFCKYDKQDFESRMLPEGPITYRNEQDKSITSKELSRMAEKVIEEIRDGKTTYTDFTVLKKSDFNLKLASGLIILKYKEHPFILKLFLKTPKTFVTQSEGTIPRFFFRMGGGTNRHLSGFTRVANLEKIKERIAESPKWSKIMDTPRKWFWLPENPQWITVEGKNIGNAGPCSCTFPAVYGIIADAIDAERVLSLTSKEDCKFGLRFANYIGNRMDAHVDNLLVEKGTGKIVIIDTEHFPTMVGLKEPMVFNDYKSWYLQLSGQCLQANYGRHKKKRRDMQRIPKPELYTLYNPSSPAS